MSAFTAKGLELADIEAADDRGQQLAPALIGVG
jgi:hypothetical protein